AHLKRHPSDKAIGGQAMGLLGDLLETVYGPSKKPSSVRASVRHWHHRDRARTATGGNMTVIGRKRTGAGRSPTDETMLLVWWDPPMRSRIEKQRSVDGQARVSIKVAGDEKWWECDDEGHVE